MSFPLRILTPDHTLFSGEADLVRVSTPQGYLGIYSGHRPLSCTLAPGEGTYLVQGTAFPFLLFGGILTIEPTHRVTLLADAELLDTLPSEASLQAAIAHAQEAMQRPVQAQDTGYAQASAQLARELLRYKITTKYRSSRT